MKTLKHGQRHKTYARIVESGKILCINRINRMKEHALKTRNLLWRARDWIVWVVNQKRQLSKTSKTSVWIVDGT